MANELNILQHARALTLSFHHKTVTHWLTFYIIAWVPSSGNHFNSQRPFKYSWCFRRLNIILIINSYIAFINFVFKTTKELQIFLTVNIFFYLLCSCWPNKIAIIFASLYFSVLRILCLCSAKRNIWIWYDLYIKKSDGFYVADKAKGFLIREWREPLSKRKTTHSFLSKQSTLSKACFCLLACYVYIDPSAYVY